MKFAKQLFVKGKRVGNIKSFGIITAENPEAKELSAAENKKRQEEFAKILKEAHFLYVPVQGHYSGNKENPYLIFNINREALTAYAKRYKQESFIYAEVKSDGEVPEFEYWEKSDAESAANAAKNPYEKKDERF